MTGKREQGYFLSDFNLEERTQAGLPQLMNTTLTRLHHVFPEAIIAGGAVRDSNHESKFHAQILSFANVA